MIINRISCNPNYPKVTPKRFKKKLNNGNTGNQIAFSGFLSKKLNVFARQLKEKEYSELFLSRGGKVTNEECEDIIKNHPYTLIRAERIIDGETEDREKIKSLLQNPKLTAKSAVALKNYFDNKFKDYRVISIGTSPAAIAETLEHLGCEVIYLPASGVNRLDDGDTRSKILTKTNLVDIKNLKVLLDYFKSKVNKEDGKTNVVIDYCCSGTSLKIITKLLRENSGVNPKNFKMISLEDLLESIKGEEFKVHEILTYDDISRLRGDFAFQSTEFISNVPHFDIDDKNNRIWAKAGRNDYIYSGKKLNSTIFRGFEEYSSRLARAYSLCTYNELKKMNLL